MRGRWKNEISQREAEWESALAGCMVAEDLKQLCQDCEELYIRLNQVLNRHPELARLVEPGIERTWKMRQQLLQLADSLERARSGFVEWREKYCANGEQFDK